VSDAALRNTIEIYNVQLSQMQHRGTPMKLIIYGLVKRSIEERHLTLELTVVSNATLTKAIEI
jgi:hypothetical protein